MRIASIIAEINTKKAENGMTNQQISDASGVPKPTVDRVLRGGTDEPRAQTLLDIAAVFDYDLVQSQQPDAARDDAHAQQIAALYESQLADLRRQLNITRAEKARSIHILGWIVAVLVLGIFAILLVDALNPTVGWFRGTVRYIEEMAKAI